MQPLTYPLTVATYYNTETTLLFGRMNQSLEYLNPVYFPCILKLFLLAVVMEISEYLAHTILARKLVSFFFISLLHSPWGI